MLIRTGLLLAVTVAGIALAAPAPRAQSGEPENEESRFTFHRADDGYLRLDGRSGQIANCIRRPVGWTCEMVPDERVALEAEIMRLQGDNAALKKALISRQLALPRGIRPELPLAQVEEPRRWLPGEAEFHQAMGFIRNVWRRVVAMVAGVQKDVMRRT